MVVDDTPQAETLRSDTYPVGILVWRKHVDDIYGGLDHYPEAAAVRSILFACTRWLSDHASQPPDEEQRVRIESIKSELEAWLSERGEPYLG